MNRREFGFLHSVFIFVAILSLVGCMGPKKPPQTDFNDISCHYSFKNIVNQKEQQKIDRIIRSIALGQVKKEGPAENPQYFFKVSDFSMLTKINPFLIYKDPLAKEKDLQQVLSAENPRFAVDYSMIDIAASIDMTVRFHITPGAKLFYTSGVGEEKEITKLVDPSGKVELKTRIYKGQEFIYARTIANKVERFIKINIYTQDVQDIRKDEYPR